MNKKKWGLWLLSLGISILQVSCGTLSSCVISDPAPAVTRLQSGGGVKEEVGRLVQPLIASGEILGAAIGVLSPDGKTQGFGYGVSGRSHEAELISDTDVFQIGSVSKLFVAAVLAILVDEGQLRYEDTVRSILPSNVYLSESLKDVTIHELVTHTGGLPRESAGFKQAWYFIRYLFTGKNLYGYLDQAYLYRYLRTCRTKSKEKRDYQYSNIGIALLVHLIEVKTKKSFPDLLEEKIFNPLQMKDTVFFLSAEQKKRLVVGHAGHQPLFMRRNAQIEPWDMGDTMRCTGGLYSTVNDLLIFAKANLGLFYVPLEKSLVATHRIQLKAKNEDIALGWVVNHFKNGRITIDFKQGMVAGYSAYIGINLDKKIAVIVLCSNFNWEDKIGHNLILRLSDGLEPLSK